MSFSYVCIIECTMKYRSTKGISGAVTLSEAVESCVAPDGGIYIPDTIPRLPRAFLNNIGEMSLRDISYVVAASFFGDDIPAGELKKIADEAFAFDTPLVEVEPGMFVLELFHGPTLTVKDYGARFMARLMKRLLPPGRRNVIVATTGNTGGAVANSFHKMEGINVFVLYPRGRLSRLAIGQFTALGDNIHPVEVSGSIEDCKRVMEEALGDPALAPYSLTGANSINVARVIPLASLAFYAYSRLVAMGIPNADKAVYSIPCGNLSNLVGTVIARRMGLPSAGIVPAYNVNSSLGTLLDGGIPHAADAPIATLSPAMDISYPSGWPRLAAIYGGDIAASRADILHAGAVSDMAIADTVNRLRLCGYAIDPHGAVAYRAAETAGIEAPKVVFATGHPAKQLDIMTRITGAAIELPVQLTRFMSVKRNPTKIPPTLPALRKLILMYN